MDTCDVVLGRVVEIVRPHRADGHGEAWAMLVARRPPKTVGEIVNRLEPSLPTFVAFLRGMPRI